MGYVYVMHGGGLKKGLVKIGSTGDIEKRFMAAKTFYGPEAKGSYVKVTDYQSHEKNIHEKLKDSQHGGELYKISPRAALQMIKAVCDKKKCQKCERIEY
ncbi:MAG: hypothetical protein Hyperionvirus6_8 [Hyperionvirus sp.]|uniref:Bacteriophage T5 Orf172 DNA-binding domain-containing protein n=1 Tax=Hyperionvirus sp. TaxID=2487770 RepID=A0A3G5A7V2_9VIRU|nr:MAG: hypothetical protein Hyperionvirus6_8 [Hyperionvirus sp.]